MRENIKKLVKLFFGILPLKNIIIFESHPDLACNTYPVFELMLDRNMNEKYKMIWLVNDKKKYTNYDINNVTFMNIKPENIITRFYLTYIQASAKCLIYSNRVIKKINNKQFSIFLSHGSLIKRLKGIYEINNDCDYMLNQSDFFTDINSNELDIKVEKLICLGYPRNDYLFNEKSSAENIINNNLFHKFIIWLPTFRQHKGGQKDTKTKSNFGIPILDSELSINNLNNILKELNILLIIKPHPAQEINYLKKQSISNIEIINDEILEKNNIQLYTLLSLSDALITDYSSVYYDYLLTDKPIGLTIDDLSEYKETRGIVFDDPFEILKGFHISSLENLIDFIYTIKNDEDTYSSERNKIKKLTNFYRDDKSTERVVDFIISNIENI